jgi:hypothetical protein
VVEDDFVKVTTAMLEAGYTEKDLIHCVQTTADDFRFRKRKEGAE